MGEKIRNITFSFASLCVFVFWLGASFSARDYISHGEYDVIDPKKKKKKKAVGIQQNSLHYVRNLRLFLPTHYHTIYVLNLLWHRYSIFCFLFIANMFLLLTDLIFFFILILIQDDIILTTSLLSKSQALNIDPGLITSKYILQF